jgi:hypothetical protein
MKLHRIRFTTAVLIALLISAISAVSAQTVIPRGTVIPVTLDQPLNSANAMVGGRFYAHDTGANAAGFPEQTRFTGKVDSVTRASAGTAGQIGVSFVGAKLPDGTRVPLVGQLTSLDAASVYTDPSSGRLIGTPDARKNNLKFAAIGAGAGLVLGQVIGKKPLIGTILGAAAGYLYGKRQQQPAAGRNVVVSAGTQFGILLAEDITIPDYSASSSLGAGPIGEGWRITFSGLQPYMAGNNLMLPLRSVMESMGIPFDFDSASKEIIVSNYDTQATHVLGTRVVNIDGRDVTMDARSRVMNGTIYVPASFIELLTHRNVSWNSRSGVLRIQ